MPVPVGAMFRNDVEVSTDILVMVVQHAEVTKQLEYYSERYSLPNGAEIGSHTAEVLHQVEGANVASGGWVGGDAWFGSVMTTVEVNTRLNVESNCIIKSNHSFYPMEALHVILKGRFFRRPLGTGSP
jgi:hypothetical protein